MIGILPQTVEVNGKEYPINTDFRVALTVLDAMTDPDLDNTEKAYVMLRCIYSDFDSIPEADYTAACEAASLFLDGGAAQSHRKSEKPVLSWQQDEALIFAAINRVAGKEVRAESYMHWWTFLGYFTEIDDKSLLSSVVQIREKKVKNKKLDKWEQDFYKTHKEMIDIKKRLSQDEIEEREMINKLIGG